MQITKEWIEKLANMYGVKPKSVRDVLWPESPTKSLTYFDATKNPGIDYLEKIADTIGCTTDEILRRPTGTQVITGNNNQVGNVNINSDITALQEQVCAYKKLIKYQEDEIQMLKDRVDRLIKLAQDNGNQ